MSDFIQGSDTTPEGEMLWCVHFASSYYDSDPRMPGQVPIDCRTFVLAKKRDDAITKAMPTIEAARKRVDKGAKERITASVVTLDEMIPARDCSDDGRDGWYTTSPLAKIDLSHPDDIARYRLGVCLIPIT